MTKWIALVLLLCAFTPVYEKHDTPEKVDQEIKEIELSVQPKRWRVLSGTPTLNDLQTNECVFVSSNGWANIMCRDNIEVYAIKMSCVTVIR